ncbi:uncharacterized protein SEPMUDRAFT_91788 [Sphaerulina musiva SO2202]|uniref:Uncharacterized protein n=1 Tax=Sphaerulina musiva (strain SO2202) TaxID=692275 RepID=N1QFJ3_SPHMS|nr:uncharacterized protein SEPMUDRAFT_91788 [Sphaerulina musiva SO2202]EMF09253.1 hypothetical protein SEPMUDRAFT_91788 [Sphaerulina musiva SO2202]
MSFRTKMLIEGFLSSQSNFRCELWVLGSVQHQILSTSARVPLMEEQLSQQS